MPSGVPYEPVPQAMSSPTSGLVRWRWMRASNPSLGESCRNSRASACRPSAREQRYGVLRSRPGGSGRARGERRSEAPVPGSPAGAVGRAVRRLAAGGNTHQRDQQEEGAPKELPHTNCIGTHPRCDPSFPANCILDLEDGALQGAHPCGRQVAIPAIGEQGDNRPVQTARARHTERGGHGGSLPGLRRAAPPPATGRPTVAKPSACRGCARRCRSRSDPSRPGARPRRCPRSGSRCPELAYTALDPVRQAGNRPGSASTTRAPGIPGAEAADAVSVPPVPAPATKARRARRTGPGFGPRRLLVDEGIGRVAE